MCIKWNGEEHNIIDFLTKKFSWHTLIENLKKNNNIFFSFWYFRYYYDKLILTKVPGRRYTYRFNVRTLLKQVQKPANNSSSTGSYSDMDKAFDTLMQLPPEAREILCQNMYTTAPSNPWIQGMCILYHVPIPETRVNKGNFLFRGIPWKTILLHIWIFSDNCDICIILS